MTKNNFELVKKSWAIIAKIDFEIVGGAFYIRLFQIAPELRPMFNGASMTEQSKKLGCMLSYVISKFDSMEDILTEVQALAKRHTKYGVKDEHYNAVGSALMWTLEQGLGDYWTDELNTAWIDFYETLSAEMIAAQHIEFLQGGNSV
jgi:nitric oxide dioxygenase